MYVHLGQNTVVRACEIVGIFDLDKTTVSAKTRDFLSKAEKRGVISVVSDGLPKSFVLCADHVRQSRMYLSVLQPSTLIGRMKLTDK